MCFVMITPNGTLPWFSLVSYSFPRSIDLIHLLNLISLKIVWRLGHCFPSPSVLAFLGISIWTIFQIGALITEAGSLHHISCPSIIAGESHVIKFPPVEYEQKGCVAPSGLAGKTPASSLSSFLSLPAGFVPELQWGKQLYPLEASMMKKCPNSLLSKMAAMCSLSIWNVACVTEELKF